MATWKLYTGVTVPPSKPSGSRPRFSLTSDIVSFRRCARQYGYFGNDGFVPAESGQAFYGTVVHQVLDRCHRHYSGLMGAPRGTMPTDADIDHYFGEVENALSSHGVRRASQKAADKARKVLKAFNRVEGPALYPRVFDTEYRLESDRDQYVLRGVVDVLATAPGAGGDPSKMEIWDYKGTKLPDLSSKTLRDYTWQMCVYAELYKARSGVYPAKAVLYFLNELDQDPEPTQRPLRAVHEVPFTPKMIQDALQEFHITALDIMTCQASAKWPTPAKGQDPGKETCDICDIRWNCGAKKGVYPMRMPI
jgi:hypothetical protein